MNKRMKRWLFQKATEVLGEEEYNSLRNDLINPVKIAAKEAAADFLGGPASGRSGKKHGEEE